VVGGGQCPPAVARLAQATGKAIALAGAVLICGGLGGVMSAAARGARRAGGLTVGILPGGAHEDANPFIDVAIVTDMSHARNAVLVRSSHALIALAGEHGTLSEIALALKMGIPVVGLDHWTHLAGVIEAGTPDDAVALALDSAARVHIRSR
jgi:uncharacterized protein (TIGR00725 family)